MANVFGLTTWLALSAVSLTSGPVDSAADAQHRRTVAEALDMVKNPKEGRAAWEIVLRDAVASNQPAVIQAEIVNKIADGYYYDNHPGDAIQPLEDIVARLRASGSQKTAVMADSLSSLGLMYSSTGKYDRNLEYQKQAVEIFEQLPDVAPARVASASNNYGAALLDAGRAYEGTPYALRAVELYRKAGLRDATVAIATGTAANIAVTGGRAETAIPLAQEAVAIAHEVLPKDNPYYGFAEATLGKALMMSGRLDEAVPHLRAGLDVLGPALGKRHALTLQVMQNLGQALYLSGRLDEAIVLAVTAAEGQAGSKVLNDAQSLGAASVYAGELGDMVRAADLSKRAYDRVMETPNATGYAAAGALRNYGEILAEQGKLDEAVNVLRRAAEMAGATMADANGRNAQADLQLAAAEIRAGDTANGLPRLQAAVRLLKERMTRYAPMAELSEDAFTYYHDLSSAAGAAIQADRADLALEYYQLATWGLNARTAQQVVVRSAESDSGLAALIRQVQEDARQARLLRRSYTSLVARGNTASAARVQSEFERLEARMVDSEAVLMRKVSGYRESRNPATIDLATIQRKLSAGDSVLIAMPSRYTLLLFAITSDGATVDTVPLGRGTLRTMVKDLRTSVNEGLIDENASFNVAAAYRLHQAMFTPKIRTTLRRGGTLHAMTGDALATFSLAMLVREPAGEALSGAKLAAVHWLVRDYAIETPMSLATMTINPTQRSNRQTFVGIGAPTLSSDRNAPIQLAAVYRGGSAGRTAISSLPVLPNARRELEQMAAVIAPSSNLLLTGADATEANIRKIDWRGRSVIAFATHGLLAGEIGSSIEPALVLTPGPSGAGNDSDSDGLLTASEILGMKLDSDLVILSACNSASGISRISAPYTGLANAFFFAGTKSLLISHWPLRDDTAARLSVMTVRGMRNGLSEAEALRRAQLALLQDASFSGASNPAAWAGFALVTR